MPPRSKIITMLPPHIRNQVERRMLAKRFSDYEGLAEWVRQQGYDISDDSLWRYGKALKQEFTAVRFTQLQARMLATQAPDHKGRLMQALLQVVQQKLFLVLAETDDTNRAEIAQLVHAVAELSRVSVSFQQWSAESRRQKKARRRFRDRALATQNIQELLRDSPDDDFELDDEPMLSAANEAREFPADEHGLPHLSQPPSRLRPDHED
jgi:uncharacterized protein DUF3486